VLSVGVLPAVADAQEARESRANIFIRSNVEFDEVHGVRSGSGTTTDPYVISGWDVASITIKDTSAPVLITDNTVDVLTLDWIGRHADVIGNDIGDLRVNQNVRRTGLPTSGRIANNTFDIVGQLRHFDGVFESNVVGQPAVGDIDKVTGQFLNDRAVNFDGFNGARFQNNEIFGYVEVRLHGHHHSSAWGEDSHQHAGGDDHMDHSIRYHEVWVTGNEITVPPGSGTALQYVDNNHAGNDRTATSETNPALNDPHVHYTQVHLTDNMLVGGGLSVNIFNADDERHIETATGRLDIDNNMVHLEASPVPFSCCSTGISVSNATDVDVFIRGNYIEGPQEQTEVPFLRFSGYGIDLSQLEAASVRVYDNKVSNLLYGVSASTFANSRWFLDGLWTNFVEEPVMYSTNVPAPEARSADPAPEGTPVPTHDHDGHQH